MADAPRLTRAERLAGGLLDGAVDDPIADDLVAWLAHSPRFRAFAEAHRAKIRKKLRSASDSESRRDVRAELRTASLLLDDPHIDLAFEAYGARRRGPDFSADYRGRRFNLEVTRLRHARSATAFQRPFLAKLRQLPPSVPNLLLVAVDGDHAEALDVATTARELRQLADRKAEAFFVARGFSGTRDFYDRYLRLGAVITWAEAADGDARAAAWINRSARIALPERAVRACLACLCTDDGVPERVASR